ncbi:hypothetical protein BD779DRAFT_1486085 [Infundibulicybe gibba]|nr:hypothetical protein BD779DRAFT_1486085 [Infundibulicybe gibba]
MINLLGLHPSAAKLAQYLAHLSSLTSAEPTPEVKSYSDAVYFNYYAFGLSILFAPQRGYKPKTGLTLAELNDDKLVIDSIDMYNIPAVQPSKAASHKAERAYSTHPISPLVLALTGVIHDKDGNLVSRPAQFEVTPETSGKDFVGTLGEPDRKGGGAGPSSGSIGIWCEWSKDGVMVEFGGDEAKGPQAWERGKDAIWKVLTVFAPKPE